jgi:polysaccharide biosynthesis protein PslG
MSNTFCWVRFMKHRTLTFTCLLVLLLPTLSTGTHAQEASEPNAEASEAAVALPAPLPAGLSSVPNGLGLNFNADGFPQSGEMNMLKDAGIHWMRTDFGWDNTEKADGYHFESYDNLMTVLSQNNIRPIFILAYDNPLYERNGNDAPDTPREQQAFTRWARASVEHFKGRGIIWELYNEPDIDVSGNSSLSKEKYVSLAKSVGAMFRKFYPNEILVGPALSHMPNPNRYPKQYAYMKHFLASHLLRYWSAVSVHPYRGLDNPETVTADYRNLRSLIKKSLVEDHQPSRSVPIISSEWGYSSRPVADSGNRNLIRDQTQGKLLARQWLINLYNRIPISIWFSWHDSMDLPRCTCSPCTAAEKELCDTLDETNQRHFGIVRFPYFENRNPVYNRKPAYHAAQTLTRTLLGSHFDVRINLHDKDDYALRFINGDLFQIAAWTTSAKHTVRIPLPPGDYVVINYVGLNPKQYYGIQDSLEIELTNAPVYIQKLLTF